jgi:phenylpyruvate tautomerase PptA (4-oxalocrotonate tautomerase family)
MTIITVRAPSGRIDVTARRELALTLTDAVLIPEIGRFDTRARRGFQVHFVDLDLDAMAINGELLSDRNADILVADIAVMEGDWPRETRAAVIQGVLGALAAALRRPEPAPAWWVNFRIIEEGS